jgi:hypothetical protein
VEAEVEAGLERLELVPGDDLGLGAVAVDHVDGVRPVLVGELAQDAEERREADAAADQDEAAGGPAGGREGAVRAVEIGGRAGGIVPTREVKSPASLMVNSMRGRSAGADEIEKGCSVRLKGEWPRLAQANWPAAKSGARPLSGSTATRHIRSAAGSLR